MEEKFNITKKPLSAPELQQKREAFTAEVASIKRVAAFAGIGIVVGGGGFAVAATAAIHSSVVTLLLSVTFVAGAVYQNRLIERIGLAKAVLAALSDADRETCLEIKQ